MSEPSRNIFNVLLLGISLVGGLSLSEFLIRWFAPQELTSVGAHDPTGMRIFDPKFVLAHKPNFEGPWARDVIVRINSLGLRDREYGSKEKNEVRILSLGDSYAFGFGVELSDSYPKVIEKMLSERFPGVKFSVMNAAVSGYGTEQQILMFERLYEFLEPDYVFATFVGANDVDENAKFHGQLEQKVTTPVGFLGRHSHLVRLILRTAHPAIFFLSNRWGPNIDYTVKLLRNLEGRFKTARLPYLMLVIPARHQIRPEVHMGSRWLSKLGLDWLIMYQNMKIISHFERDEIPYLNLHTPLVEHDKLERVIFIGDSHTNPVGHRVMAEAVFRRIEPEIAELVRNKRH